MAKVSKVNVSITGDSKGLTKATDEAAANMRRLRAEKEATAKKLGQFKQETNQVAESIAKLGFAPRGLQAIGALGFMGSLGSTGLRYAALGGIAAGIGAVASAYADMGDEARAAADAQAKVLAGRATWRELGFTERGGMALASQAEKDKAIGFSRGLSQSLALANESAPRSNLQNIMEYGPGALGAVLGGFAAGGIMEAPDIANAIGQTEQKRLSDSLHEELPFTMSVVDLTVDLMGLMFRSSSR